MADSKTHQSGGYLELNLCALNVIMPRQREGSRRGGCRGY